MLSKPDILKSIREGGLEIHPQIDEADINQVSVDLRLGQKFTTFKPPAHMAAIQMDEALWDASEMWDTREETDRYLLEPHSFILAHTLESVTIPGDLVGLVHGRSRYARIGLSIHVTAPKIDPGFSNTITLEMFNHGDIPIVLRPKVDKPAQLVLFRLSQALPETELYGCRSTDIFQYQNGTLPRKK